MTLSWGWNASLHVYQEGTLLSYILRSSDQTLQCIWITFLNKTREWPSSTTRHAHLEPCLQQASILPLIDVFILIPKDFCWWCFQTMLALSIKKYILWELYQSWELSGKNSRLARQDFVNCFHSGIKPLASCMLITHFTNRLHTSNPWKNFFFLERRPVERRKQAQLNSTQ